MQSITCPTTGANLTADPGVTSLIQARPSVATGDIIKHQSFVYGSFVWGIHVRYNNVKYF